MIAVRIHQTFLGSHVLPLPQERVAHFIFAVARLAAARLFVLAPSVVGSVVREFEALLRVHNHISNLVAKIGLRQQRQVDGRKRRNHILLAVSLFDQLVVALG